MKNSGRTSGKNLRKKKSSRDDVILVQIGNLSRQINAVEMRLDSKINNLDVKIDSVEMRLGTKIEKNTVAIEKLSQGIDALGEDLVAAIKDTIMIRKHVGMALPEEE